MKFFAMPSGILGVLALTVALCLLGCATPPEPEAPRVPPSEAVTETDDAPADAPAPEQDRTDPVYAVGETGPAGGIVFFSDRRNEFPWSYLEAAPEGWYQGQEDPAALWGPPDVETGASGSTTGTGEANTVLITQAPADHAAHLASGAMINGFDDWFLPSNQELHALYENLFRRQAGGLLRESYWSSTERNPERAMAFNFDTGGQISAMKTNAYRVRPIRAF
ncbi:hypothetical protein AU468_09545 [Alkalispirochaeta sphaeroplastigenens]|uniref:Lcl C-terminal domain-containing protein n=1 Tax=Alkalispirochaeta sphaeroplastigenens TaxID=1187066 RepID=A0A2S4JM99_9SPIO|nr:DUF1566 domain-containing protein [Alkalispirochaeta sphaeroplastigenens]POR00580.1 hypothetical protein AU468_09545 [Alkalispirochaeta sphaeroplastigenens]